MGSIHPICKYLRRDGVYLFRLIGTGRGITSSVPFPEQGRGAGIALLYWSPLLPLITLSLLPQSLDGCIQVRAAAVQPSSVSDLSTTDLSIQKRAVLMYSDEKLLFYDLFIKSLIENCGVCLVALPSSRVTRS